MKGAINYDVLLNPAPCHAEYRSTLAPLTSASLGSDWSDASSQSSDDSSESTSTTSSSSSQSTTCDLFCHERQGEVVGTKPAIILSSPSSHASGRRNGDVVPPELRQNPRRSSTSSTSRSGCPPKLVHQQDRKVNFVDSLVGKQFRIHASAVVPVLRRNPRRCCSFDGGSRMAPIFGCLPK